ncbi:MAG TPA: MotA/TolQ/ExbB proton channel family protein [Polyangia bacterium]|jgi:biopolymer transport protein ExbB/biopolymer transport protein TolQ|nr:MotA/TolQ/ExbB proton channel family protein [Polyangia bacterium]
MLIQKLMYVARPAAQVVLYLLIALSVLSIGVIIERWWFFRRRKVDINELGDDLERALRSGDTSAAFAVLRESRSVEAKILTDALKWKADGAESVEQILAKAVRRNRPPVEVGLLFLGTLGNNAPFIGLFGTVLGIMTSFRQLGSSQGASGMDNVMGSIGEALTATAIGILVALPAVIGYNVFQKKGADIEENAAALGNIVLATMKSGGGGGHGQLPVINGGVEAADLAHAGGAEASVQATRRAAGVEV